jgi:hypothetical protein
LIPFRQLLGGWMVVWRLVIALIISVDIPWHVGASCMLHFKYHDR